jgi:tetratricopeptide (TPR) repeat protein
MKLVLVLMIKNEERILKRCLEAVESLVDCFCICDTGSTDKTVEIANEFLKTHKGNLTVEPFRDFGYNRTVSFQNAVKYVSTLGWNLQETYALLLDADMMFVQGKLKNYPLTAMGYSIIQLNGSLEYYNLRIARMDFSWKCLGVTHEYWDGPAENLGKEVCYIDDRNDGGCKQDKFERDARLLEKGLQEEPTNVRYMFYLAQTYKCVGRHKDAIKMYKKRIAAGGWDEEIWNSYYSIGECYISLNDIPKFECWMLKAHAYRPHRSESIFKLTEHFRKAGANYKAYEYCLIGLKIPFPGDILFVETWPYRGGFGYEKTILDYYVNSDKKIGLRDTVNYLLKNHEHAENVISNLKFYVNKIPSTLKKVEIQNPFGNDFRPSAISVLNYPFANARFVNYQIQPDGSYTMPNGIVITKNAYVNLETGEATEMTDPSPLYDSHIKGIEDLRIYQQNDKTLFTATTYKQFIPDMISIVSGSYNIETHRLENVIGINSPTNSGCEKNWVHVPNTDHFIYSWSPLRVGKIVNDKFYFFKETKTPQLFNHIRGSAPPIDYNGNWLTLVHFVEYSAPRKYYHCFIKLSKSYELLDISLPFYFRENRIEYCLSVIQKNDNLSCFVSLNDCDPHEIIIKYSDLEWIIITGDKSKNNIVRVPADLKSYWDGGYSKCLAKGSIENYVNESINKQNLEISAIFSSSDGVLGTEEYIRQYNCVGRNIANISENKYNVISKNKIKGTVSATAVLCSRQFESPNMLLLPLDDDTFAYGLTQVLSNFMSPTWENRKSSLFWRGGSSGYDRPSIRMQVTNMLYNNLNSNVRLTKWGNWENEKDIPEEHFADRCDIQTHLNYKYILIVDGNCIASNHQWVFGSGSVPVMVTHPDNNYWFKKFLKPMENYVPIKYDLSDLAEKLQWLVENDVEAQKIANNALQFSKQVFTTGFQRKYIDEELLRISRLDTISESSKNMDWVEGIVSAWTGHRNFAEWIVTQYSNPTVVELGVDYGYSTFVFANALKGTTGTIYGIDLFAGDVHAGYRNTYEGVIKNIKDHDVTNIEIIMGDFTHVSKLWNKPINILHIDGLHTYEAVKNDFTNWSKFVDDSGIILFHDTAIQHFGIKDFFRELDGYRLYFTHSAGLGIYTKNEQLYKLILSTFDNVHDFNTKPF